MNILPVLYIVDNRILVKCPIVVLVSYNQTGSFYCVTGRFCSCFQPNQTGSILSPSAKILFIQLKIESDCLRTSPEHSLGSGWAGNDLWRRTAAAAETQPNASGRCQNRVEEDDGAPAAVCSSSPSTHLHQEISWMV